jgi:hypothetical protein
MLHDVGSERVEPRAIVEEGGAPIHRRSVPTLSGCLETRVSMTWDFGIRPHGCSTKRVVHGAQRVGRPVLEVSVLLPISLNR